jgi:tRNA nucleotidyltransferase (CCA-adding enzyme)
MKLPSEVRYVLNTLHLHGYKAHCVGGCCRDDILNKTPKDFDITTSALPNDVLEVFKYNKVIPTGLQHGTVTVVLNNEPIEVTTFRVDGEYEDGRHPNSVRYTNYLILDLSRRDFTCNSIAYNSLEGYIDPFNGTSDINNKIIKCVGIADDRMKEDALRMMRGFRFACQLGFELHETVLDAIYNNSKLLEKVSKERIQSELNKMLISDSESLGHNLIKMYTTGLMKHIIPELLPLFDTTQNNPNHIFDVGIHTIKAVESIKPTLHLRLTMLLHDIGKPICKTTGEDGVDHFYKHNIKGYDMTNEILRRLKYDNDTIEKVNTLVLYHDSELPNKNSIKRMINRIGMDLFLDLLDVKTADTMAQHPNVRPVKLNHITQLQVWLDEIIAENECFTRKDLVINGKDLINLGYPQGKKLGIILDKLLEYVIENPDKNTKDDLIKYIKEECL